MNKLDEIIKYYHNIRNFEGQPRLVSLCFAVTGEMLTREEVTELTRKLFYGKQEVNETVVDKLMEFTM
jgi:hypothetical protein